MSNEVTIINFTCYIDCKMLWLLIFVVFYSLQTYPAARIVGRGFKWTTNEPGDKNSQLGQFNNHTPREIK